jgi:hypothetical protein
LIKNQRSLSTVRFCIAVAVDAKKLHNSSLLEAQDLSQKADTTDAKSRAAEILPHVYLEIA